MHVGVGGANSLSLKPLNVAHPRAPHTPAYYHPHTQRGHSILHVDVTHTHVYIQYCVLAIHALMPLDALLQHRDMSLIVQWMCNICFTSTHNTTHTQHIYTHTGTHSHSHTGTHTLTHRNTQTHTNIHKHTFSHTNTHAGTHSHTQKHKHKHTHSHIHKHTHTHTHILVHTSTNTHTHTQAHTLTWNNLVCGA